MKVFVAVAKVISVWLVLMIVSTLAGLIGAPAVPAITTAEPLNSLQAELIVTGVFAIVLSLLAARMQLAFLPKLLTLFVVFYGVESVMSEIEAIYFNASLHLASGTLIFVAISAAVTAAAGAAASAYLWPAKTIEPTARLGGLGWKIPVIAPLYIICYFGAGALIAWQSPAVRAYYANGAHIDMVPLLLLQVVRGMMWAGLGAMIVKSVSGSGLLRALMTGLAFAFFAVPPLLYPNAFMPWAVRQVHLVEVFSSNLVFGYLAGSILLIGNKAKASQSA